MSKIIPGTTKGEPTSSELLDAAHAHLVAAQKLLKSHPLYDKKIVLRDGVIYLDWVIQRVTTMIAEDVVQKGTRR